MNQLTFLGPLESDNWRTDHCLRSSSLILLSLWQPLHRGCDPTVVVAVIISNLSLLKNCVREVITWEDHIYLHIIYIVCYFGNEHKSDCKNAQNWNTVHDCWHWIKGWMQSKQAALKHLCIINTMLPVTLFPLHYHVIANSGLHNADCVPELTKLHVI